MWAIKELPLIPTERPNARVPLHEITVQRLASELDNKQTFKPVQSREFVELPHKYLTLWDI